MKRFARAHARERRDLDDDPDQRPMLKVGEAAQVLGVSRWTVHRWLELGKLANVRHYMYTRRQIRFDAVDLFRVAFPTASDDKIAELMYQFNQEQKERRRKVRKEERAHTGYTEQESSGHATGELQQSIRAEDGGEWSREYRRQLVEQLAERLRKANAQGRHIL